MEMPQLLEIAAHGVTAMLATWLGLTVLVRGPRRPGAQAFSLVVVLLVIWSVAIIVRRLTGEPGEVDETARAFEILGAYPLPAAVLTVAIALTVERQAPPWLRTALIGFWALSIAATGVTIVSPDLEPRIT